MDDLAVCALCGCSDEDPCPGGCFWVPPEISGQLEDVCSSHFELSLEDE